MTLERGTPASYAALLRFLALILGLFLLADSVSQLVQASNGLQVASRNWRIANFRLIFTQITPLVLGLLLVGQYMTRNGRWKGVGIVSLLLALVILGLAVVYLGDASAVMGTLAGPPLGQMKRTSAQVLLSSLAFGLALLWVGMMSLRTRSA
ncbi:MAG TPA: hypothetical protein VJU15_04130 [Gemmatimonadales bacterium]|nr:hypothetical protein [Gemmatimonadales bacterium]